MLVLGSLLIFLAAAATIFACAMAGLGLLGGALNANRPAGQRRRRGFFAALAFLGCGASAAAGFVGISALWWAAQRSAPP
jgi:hypothetical protein